MSDQFVGEIRCFGFNFAPYGWAQCTGQLLSIQQNAALFSLIGTYYGGNGTSNFALPNFQGIAPLHQGQGTGLSPYVVGEQVGTENVTLSTQQMPLHNHNVNAATNVQGGQSERGPTPQPLSYLGESAIPDQVWIDPPNTMNTSLSPAVIGFSGSGQPHSNQQPYLTINFCISLTGAFPTRG